MSQNVYSVSALVHYIKQTLDNDIRIQSILIKGEISNFTNHRSGHWYFTLKDTRAKISCVMFSSHARRCHILLKEGMTFAIEPMVHAGKPHTRVLADDWTVVTKDGSLAAHYEHTIVITHDGYEILTINPDEEEDSVYGQTGCH